MKKLICVIGLISTALLTGCGPNCKNAKDIDDPWTEHGRDIHTKIVEIDGHNYILLDGTYCGGIVHAESCHCRHSR